MEKYRVLQRLGKGAQGSVYLTQSKVDGKKYVLKKIECPDESEANKAFKEAMALAELRHPYVCGYKEFFVEWDKEEAAMYVNIVMEYYKNGDLNKILKDYRARNEPIEEIHIKKWLGQIIEALAFVHGKDVIHRDLKPSNIFLQEDLNICIGDFGVATVMGDARTRTRKAIGSMNWMAPEVLERPYDERSDVWSLGCIALEMTSCSFCDTALIAGKLFEIKHSQQTLDGLLLETAKLYSVDLTAFIRVMLRRDFKQRSTAEELLLMPFVKDCVALSRQELSDKKNRNKKEALSKSVPKDQGVKPVLDYIQVNQDNDSCVNQALEYLAELTKQEGYAIDVNGKRQIVRCMRVNLDEPDILTSGCQIFNNLIVTANVDDVLYSEEVISVVPMAMKAHPGSAQLQQTAASLLMALSADEGAAELIGNIGGIGLILDAMRRFPDNMGLVATCCSALWSLAVNGNNARILTDEKGIQDVVKTMRNHKMSPEVMEAACAALLSLSMEDENVDASNDLECVGLLIQALELHTNDAKVVKNSCLALSSLIEHDEESAFKVLINKFNGEEVQGIPVIVRAYENHRDNAKVVESLCSVVQELCEYVDICAEVKFLRVKENMLSEIHQRYKDNEDIMNPCEVALNKLK